MDYALSKRFIVLAQLIPEVYTVSDVLGGHFLRRGLTEILSALERIDESIHVFAKILIEREIFFVMFFRICNTI